MRNKVISVLKSLNESEIEEFELFLRSPFFNKSEKQNRLFTELKKFYPDFENDELTPEKLHKAISPERKFNEITMRRLLFDLEKLSLSFLSHKGLKDDQITTNVLLRNKLEQKSLNKIFIESVLTSENMFKAQGMIDEKYFLSKIDLETDKYNFSYINNKISSRKDLDSLILNLVTGSNFLFLYYIMKVTKHYLNLKVLQVNYSDIEQENKLKEFLNHLFTNMDEAYLKDFLKEGEKDYYPIYEIYKSIYYSFAYPENAGSYFKWKDNLFAYVDNFSQSEKSFLITNLLNYCALNIRSEGLNKIYTKELFSLYELILAKKYYIVEGSEYLPEVLYRSILKFSLEASKYKWAEKFIKVYSSRLHPSLMTNMKYYGYGRLYFETGDHAKAISYFSRIKLDSFNVKMDVKNFTLMCHYELGNYEVVIPGLTAYKTFMKGNKMLSKENKQRYKNFALFLEKFIRLLNNRNKTYVEVLQKQLKAENNIVHKDWLMWKSNQLVAAYRRTA